MAADCDPYALDDTLGVLRRSGREGEIPYSDGEEVEERLAAVVRAARDRSLLSDELAAEVTDWPSAYHLSPRRANLLRPFAPRLRGRVLEVGAGCGALTRFLGECGADVVALEPSLRRAGIAAARCRDLRNVRVVCDRIESFAGPGQFDVVTLVGVLEYAPVYGSGDDPVGAMLARCRSLLAPAGLLLVAIENQLGLKYFAGYVEDHLGVAMLGIEDLYGTRSPMTLGRCELLRRLAAAGFGSTALSVPLPDYKLPVSLVTPAGLEDESWRATLAELVAGSPYVDAQRLELPVFSLEQAWRVVVRNGLLADLANSLLVAASPAASADLPDGREVLAYHWGLDRRTRFRKVTEFRREGGIVRVSRALLAGGSAEPEPDDPVRLRVASEPLRTGTLWTEGLSRLANAPGWDTAALVAWAQPWIAQVARAAGAEPLTAGSLIPGRLLDAAPFNLVRSSEGELSFIDLEWESRMPIPFGRLFVRGLLGALVRLRTVARPGPDVPDRLVGIIRKVAEGCGLGLSDADIDRALEAEEELHRHVSPTTPPGFARSLAALTLPRRAALGELVQQGVEVATLRALLGASEAEVEAVRGRMGRSNASLRAQLEATRRSLPWRPTAPLRAGRRLAGGSIRALACLIRWVVLAPGTLAFAARPENRRNARLVAASGLVDRIGTGPADPLTAGRGGGYFTALDYLRRGSRSGRRPNPLFDPRFYLETNPDVAAAGVDPLVHFVGCGAFEGRSPHPLFDTRYYLAANPDVAAARINPLAHFLRSGGFEGRRPNAEFDPETYQAAHPEIDGTGVNPLVHLVLARETSGR